VLNDFGGIVKLQPSPVDQKKSFLILPYDNNLKFNVKTGRRYRPDVSFLEYSGVSSLSIEMYAMMWVSSFCVLIWCV